MAFIDSVQIENFKSFQGVNNFKLEKFTAIADVHGQGKDDFFEALMFVFARKKSTEKQITKFCSHFQRDADSRISVCVKFLRSDDSVTVRRTLLPNGFTYEVNEGKVSVTEFDNTLETLGIDAETIDLLNGKLLLSVPKNVTHILEVLSGSAEEKARYDELARATEQIFMEMKSERFDRIATIAKMKILERAIRKDEESLDVGKLDEMKRFYFIISLYLVDNQLEKLEGEANEIRSSVPALEIDRALRKKLKETEDNLESLLKSLAEKNEAFEHFPKMISELEREETLSKESLASARQRQEFFENEISKLSDKLKEAEEAEVELSKRESVDDRLELLGEFDSLDLKAKEATATDRGKWQALNDAGEHLSVIANAVQSKIDCIMSAVREKRAELDEAKNRESDLIALIEQMKEGQKRAETLRELTGKLEDLKAKYKSLSNELTAQAYEFDRVSKRESYNREVDQELKALFGDKIFGRVSRVCRPKKKEFEMAVMTVFGEFVDAIVVDSETTAMQCVQHLDESPDRVESEKFIPLNSLELHPVRNILRTIKDPPHTVLALDALDYPQEIHPVVVYITRNNVICRTLDDAFKVAYDVEPDLRADAVSLNGVRCLTNGSVSYTSESSLKTSKWDHQAYVDRKNELDQMRLDIRDTTESISVHGTVESPEVFNHKIERAVQQKDDLSQKIAHLVREMSALEEKLTIERREFELKKTSLNEILEEKRLLEGKMESVRRSFFLELCRKVGLNSYDELQRKVTILRRPGGKEKIQLLKKQVAEQLNLDSEIQAHNIRCVSRWESNLREVADLKRQLSEDYAKNVSEMKNLEEMKAHYQDERHKLNKGLNELEKERPNLASDANRLEDLTVEIERELERRSCLLIDCKANNVALNVVGVDRNVTEFTDEELKGSRLSLDYSSLPEKYKKIDSRSLKNYVEELEKRIANAMRVFETVHINTDVSENRAELEKLKLADDTSKARLKLLNVKLKGVRVEFEKTKFSRYQKFMDCFERVNNTAEFVYKKLNAQGSNSSLLLSPQNPLEPYLGGIELTCIPANKRAVPFESLSAGEKKKAFSSLFLAFFDYWPGAFMIYEGLEINFDLTSAELLGEVIRELTGDRNNFQVVVISTKEKLICKAHKIIGLYHNIDDSRTKAIHMDLK